jgi:TonB-linked SusC/RagA family outer membrane protein
MRKLLSLSAALVLCSVLAVAQTRTVTGKITDDKGDPVPFATITIKGTRNATVADQTGSFSLKAKPGDVLVVSAQGMDSKEATVASEGNVSVSMTRANAALTEVVVTGAYNTKRTARGVSYNAQVVNAEQLNTIRQTNLNNALAGKVAGIQVRSQSAAALNRTGSVRLRGESGLGGGEGIIYVVDGTILPSANDINVDDIEDVTVLQGPAAAAQFGSQGANGAIVITLKKAKRGQKGIGVDVNLGAQFDKVYILPNYQNTYAGGSTYDMIRYDWQPGQPEEWKALSGKYYHDYSDDASWGPKMVGQEYIPWYAWYGGTKYSYKTAFLNPNEDNARDFFETGIVLNNSVAISKATDNMNLRFSYGNVDVKGLLPTTGLRKNTFNFNSTFDLNEHFTVGANVNYITQNTRGEFDDGYSNQSTGSFNQWFHRDLDMGIMRELKDLRTPEGIYASWNHNNPTSYQPSNTRTFYAGNYWYNFFTWFDLVKPVQNNDRLFGDVSLTYKFNNDLRIRGTYRKQQNSFWSEAKYSSDLATSGTQTTGNCGECRGYYSTNESNSNRENLELIATYSKKLNDIQFNANVGTDFFRWLYKQNSAATNNGLNVPNLFAIFNSKDQPSVGNSRIEEKYRAVFVKGDIGFRNMLFADFTLRNDWYSTLPPDNNDVLSKSVGASFVFSDLLKVPAISFGKIRASWGEIPQALGLNATEFGAYRYPGNLYGVNSFQWNGNFLMNATDSRVDSAIHGAVKSQKEIGLDMKFLKNRVGFSVTYWDATEKDIPRSVGVDPTNGINSILINTGEITKKGIDVQVNARPVWGNDFRWEFNGTWGRLLENKVVKIADDVDRLIIEGLWGATGSNAPVLVHAVGKDWGQIYGNGIKRINGQPVLNDEGFYVNDPAVYYGGVLPDFTGGIQNMFEYKGFVLNANIDYQVGGKFFSLSDMWGSYSGLTARTAVSNDKGNPIRDAVADGGGVHVFGVDKDGKPVDKYVEAQDYFHNLYNNKVFDEFVYDLSFVKLREVSLGYQIPINKIGNLSRWVNRATFSVVARNPWLIYSKTKDFDPSEISSISGESGNFPGTRGFGFNLRVGL